MLLTFNATMKTIASAACYKKNAELINDYESLKWVGMAFVY
jgi:hypothetical protein